MKANIMPRIAAYFIDILLITFVSVLITGFLPRSTVYEKAVEKENKIIEKASNGEAKFDELLDELYEVRYDIDKETIHITLVSCVLYLAYFGTYAFYNNGQTFGKKLLKMKIEYNGNKKYQHIMYLLRACLVHGIFTSIISTILVIFMSKSTYGAAYSLMSVVNTIFLFSTLIVSSFREDGKGIHDLICGTQVIQS